MKHHNPLLWAKNVDEEEKVYCHFRKKWICKPRMAMGFLKAPQGTCLWIPFISVLEMNQGQTTVWWHFFLLLLYLLSLSVLKRLHVWESHHRSSTGFGLQTRFYSYFTACIIVLKLYSWRRHITILVWSFGWSDRLIFLYRVPWIDHRGDDWLQSRVIHQSINNIHNINSSL